MRDAEAAKTGDYTAGAAAVYLTKSTDGGKTWSKNQRLSTDVCPCCRVSFGFVGGRVVVSWRAVVTGDIRDIHFVSSADKGATWTQPRPIAVDNWKIKGCPHVGASLATAGDKLYAIWFTEAGGKPGIFLASSTNGVEFTPKRSVSDGTTDATHPFVAAYENRLGVAFQARDAKAEDSWGKMSIYYREIGANGTLTPLQKVGVPKVGAVNYPSLALGMSGRTFIGWTETRGEKGPQAVLVRGRLK